MPSEFDFQYAMENTRVLHEPDRRIDTFGSTQFEFQLVSELMDAANVWTVNEDKSRPGSQISASFYKELGIGYGYGLRMDLDYFILRLDLGYKLYNPYKINGTHILKDELKKFPGGSEIQIAVGLNFD